MSAHIEIQENISDRSVERAYRRAKQIQKDKLFNARARSLCEQGMRAAKARDPKLLKTLDKAAEVMEAMQERQLGETRRQEWRPRREQGEQTAVALWKKAYEFADKGDPIPGLVYIYAAAAELAGLTV